MIMLRKLRDKFITALLFGRFEPIETTISASALVHGAILLGHNLIFGPLLGVSGSLEVFVGSALCISGISIIRSICKEYRQVRRLSAFGQFLSWTLLTVIISYSPLVHYLLHFGYATLSLISAFVYLNLSLGDRND